MTQVFYFSGAGHSKAVAEYLADRLHCTAAEMSSAESTPVDLAVAVFPVYCQNLPPVVKTFLKGLQAERLALAATYGGFSPGNVLQEAASLTAAKVIAGVILPTGHSFLGEDTAFDAQAFIPFLGKLSSHEESTLPKLPKNPFSDFFPALRSRVGLKILKSDACNHCGICTTRCPMAAMKNGVPTGNCIRCLRCVSLCPQKALSIRTGKALRHYLNGKRSSRVYLYV